MLQLIRYVLFITFVSTICINVLAQDDPIKVELESNKTEYICGEPVLLKTSVINTSENANELSESGYDWREDSYTMSISYNDDEFKDYFTLNRKLDIMGPRRSGYVPQPYYVENFIPQLLEGKQQAEMTDLFIIPKPGNYKVKSVLKDFIGKEKIYESEPISFKVLSLDEREDNISQINDPNFTSERLGKTISSVHYLGKLGNRPQPDGRMSLNEFEKIAPEIINNHKDSVFREYVMYADIMTHERQDSHGSQYHPLPEKYKQQAYEFAKEYPDSWLLSTLYLRLSETFIYEKDLDKADEYVDKSMELAPNASFLGAGAGHAKINRIRQRMGNTIPAQVQTAPFPPPKKKPLGIVIPVAGASIAGIVIASLILFFRKKKPHKAD